MITKYQAKYYAHLLTQRAIGGDIDSISQSLLNAAVDINPHQIEAALFAFRSPLSKGVILADEVGLGKTIEAGLVLCQYWVTGRRKIIIACPATLRKQWGFELSEKFGIENEILDSKRYNDYLREGKNPFKNNKVIICSLNFVARRRDDIRLFGFDLAIIDEAHKLRNVYKKNSLTAHAIRDALDNVKKLLLTATPFQNSLMELYGLSTVIDRNIYGDAKSFRSEYVNEKNFSDLRDRLKPYYKRTLRKDVTEYINYTKRLPLTQQFDASDLEFELYSRVSEFLRSDDLYSIPVKQKMLTTMIVRKILASSTYALIGTLSTIKARLVRMLDENKIYQFDIADLCDDDEKELYIEDNVDSDIVDDVSDFRGEIDEVIDREKINIKSIKSEIATLSEFIELARKIQHDSKSKALLTALDNAFQQIATIGANRKALIFTESTRTQSYLVEYLKQNGYKYKIAIFNGSNTDPESNAILDAWIKSNSHTGKVSGIRSADRRAAIVEYFQSTADILIATEAAAEGLNLQFCSLVVNYDLPWNPQRIEQRIGRCHRYGQKSDVVVVNFVNRRNYADTRVFSLLNDKFKLFSDVFGASDEVLGQIDGMDFEKRIWQIYQECRTEIEINAAFEHLQAEFQYEISTRMDDVKEQVLNTFDIEVQERLKLAKENTNAFLNRYEYIFWELTKHILQDYADFNDVNHTFLLQKKIDDFEKNKYRLISNKESDGKIYRLSDPLAQFVISTALALPTTEGKIIFTPADTNVKITLPDELIGKDGYMILTSLDVSAFDSEQYSLFTAYTSDGQSLSQEICEKLMLCAGLEQATTRLTAIQKKRLTESSEQHRQGKLQQIESRNLSYFKEEEDRILRWEKDLINSLENEIDTVKRNIREQERAVRNATTIEDKIAATQKLDDLERNKRKKRNDLVVKEDEITDKRRKYLSDLDSRKIKQTKHTDIFFIKWEIKNDTN
jgi:hypothetical protein